MRRKRVIRVNDNTHRLIKQRAARKGVSIEKYMDEGARRKRKSEFDELDELFW